MSEFDDEAGFHVRQHFSGGAPAWEEDIDYTASYADRDRTGGGVAFEKRDMYDMSPEGKMMIEVRKDLATYNFPEIKEKTIEEAIKRHDVALKQSNAPLIVSATLFLYLYENRNGLTKANFAKFAKYRRKSIKKLDLIRYIRYLQNLGMEINEG